MSRLTQVGSELKVRSGNIVPAARTAGTAVSSGVDRLNPQFMSGVLVVQSGAVTGTPDSFTLAGKIEHSDDNSSWSDLSGASITSIAAASSVARKAVDLSGAKRYVRASITAAFVNGTSPAVNSSALLILGGAKALPTSD